MSDNVKLGVTLYLLFITIAWVVIVALAVYNV